MEKDIFQRMSNTSTNIAIDQFHPRLVANAHIKHSGLDKYGIPLHSGETSFIEDHSSVTAANIRAQTSNQGFRKYTKFFKFSKTANPSIDIATGQACSQYAQRRNQMAYCWDE